MTTHQEFSVHVQLQVHFSSAFIEIVTIMTSTRIDQRPMHVHVCNGAQTQVPLNFNVTFDMYTYVMYITVHTV